MAEPARSQTTPAPSAAKRINVLKFNLAGYIEVNTKDVKTITKAADAFNKCIADLKGVGAKITRDEEPQFTTVAADTGEE